jgi:Flp pilus assembly protein TadD/thiol-disulfide isomerase/thioredoxin
MVSMPYRTFDDEARNIEDLAGTPVLVNIWASWCVPCKAELQGIIENEAALRDAGVRVIALTVDGIDPAHDSTPADARAMLERMGFGFESGIADEGLIAKLELYQNQVFEAHVPIPVPTSFLLDADGNLAAIYRGPVDAPRVIRDSQLPPAREALIQVASPFPGTWHTAPPTANRLALAEVMLDNGYLHDALKLMSIYRDEYVQENGQPPTLTRYAQFATNLGATLSRQGHMQIAAAITQEAIMADPSIAKPRANLGSMLIRMGQTEQGIEHLRAAVEMEPDSAFIRQLLGNALLDAGRPDEAIEQYRRVVELEPDHADAHNNIGIILGRQGDTDAALGYFIDAARLAPDNAHYRVNLARELLSRDRMDEAAEHLRHAATLPPQSPQLADAVARAIATAPLADRIDPQLAIDLAEYTVAQTQRRIPDALDTLGAAYANAGRFQEAAAVAREGAAVAREYQRNDIAELIEQHAALYASGKPYREAR